MFEHGKDQRSMSDVILIDSSTCILVQGSSLNVEFASVESTGQQAPEIPLCLPLS